MHMGAFRKHGSFLYKNDNRETECGLPGKSSAPDPDNFDAGPYQDPTSEKKPYLDPTSEKIKIRIRILLNTGMNFV
jgi:hypothetical protein